VVLSSVLINNSFELFRISKETQSLSTTKIAGLMEFKETVAVYLENELQPVHIFLFSLTLY
jgi:hypothetical protein